MVKYDKVYSKDNIVCMLEMVRNICSPNVRNDKIFSQYKLFISSFIKNF